MQIVVSSAGWVDSGNINFAWEFRVELGYVLLIFPKMASLLWYSKHLIPWLLTLVVRSHIPAKITIYLVSLLFISSLRASQISSVSLAPPVDFAVILLFDGAGISPTEEGVLSPWSL